VFGFDSVKILSMAVSMSIMMVDLFLLYCAVVSVLSALIFLGVCLCMIVYVGRWSVMGGDIVPAVMSVSMIVVRVLSMRVAVLWCGSYLVGEVIVVCRLFSMRKL